MKYKFHVTSLISFRVLPPLLRDYTTRLCGLTNNQNDPDEQNAYKNFGSTCAYEGQADIGFHRRTYHTHLIKQVTKYDGPELPGADENGVLKCYAFNYDGTPCGWETTVEDRTDKQPLYTHRTYKHVCKTAEE